MRLQRLLKLSVAGLLPLMGSKIRACKLADTVVLTESEAIPRKISGYSIGELRASPSHLCVFAFEISTLIFCEACVLKLMNQARHKRGGNEEDPQVIKY